MAKLRGPLFSLNAHGTIGTLLEYSKRRGLNFIRKHQKPTDERTTAQDTERLFFKESLTSWNSLLLTEQAAWYTYNKDGTT